MDHILYHYPCNDGFGAAFAAWYSGFNDGQQIKEFGFHKFEYQKALPDISGETLYLLDCSLSVPGYVEMLNKRFKRIVLIDHHKSAAETISELITLYPEIMSRIELHIDQTKSGAVLAWEYFNKGKDVPELLLYIQDRDLWKWEMGGTAKIHNGLNGYIQDFWTWHNIYLDWQSYKQELLHKGEAILFYQDRIVQEHVQRAQNIFFTDTDELIISGMVVNATCLWSEIGHEILKAHPKAKIAATYYFTHDGFVKFSLRSRGDCDCTKIAKQFGGGGHKPAAGFKISAEYFHKLVSFENIDNPS